MSVDIKIGGSINDIVLSNNSVNQNFGNSFFKDSIAPGNALGGNIADTVGQIAETKYAKSSIDSFVNCLTKEFFIKLGKDGILDSKVANNCIMDPRGLPTISFAQSTRILQ